MPKQFDQTEAKQRWFAQRRKKSTTSKASFRITSQARPQNLPQSFAQQRLWLLEQWEPGTAAYLLPHAWRLHGELDHDALESSLTGLATRHEILRTTFAMIDGQPVQIVHPSGLVSLPIQDLTNRPKSTQEEEIKGLIHHAAHQSFDLTTGPLWRGRLLRLGTEDHVLLLMFHHIIIDGWSMGIILQELNSLYVAHSTGQPSLLPPLPLQYADFAIWQHQWLQGEVLNRELTYWRTQLADAPLTLELPTDFPRPSEQTYHGQIIPFTLQPSLTQALNALSRQEGVTLFMTLLAAFHVLLFRYTNQRDILIGTPIAGRTHTELEGLIGFFVNTLVVRLHVNGQPTFREILEQVRETCLEAYSHQDLPFEKLVEALQPVRDPSRHPLFQVMFQVFTKETTSLSLPGLHITQETISPETSQFDLNCTLQEHSGSYRGTLEFNADVFSLNTMEQLITHYQQFLQSVITNPNHQVNTISLLTDTEQRKILVEWNPFSSHEENSTLCLHQLIDSQVSRTPESIALVHETDQLTYAALAEKVNQLAHWLREHGIGPDVRVGICLERGLELISSLLGILKSGGAYVALDPTSPANRLHLMLRDAAVTMILTSTALRDKLATDLRYSEAIEAKKIRVIAVDAPWPDVDFKQTLSPEPVVRPENLAYVLYTSGSTGQPKGVAIQHRSAVALVHWAQKHFLPEELSGVLASTSICFDLSVFELFVPLSSGGTVVLAENALALPTLPMANQVTLINSVPSAAKELLRLRGIPSSVQVINLAGEPLRTELADQIYAIPSIKKVYDLYGPSETTTYSTVALRSQKGPETIGRPITKDQVYVMDSIQHLLPAGVEGEMLIGGEGIARGYQNNPALTAQKFIPHPYSAIPGARLYRSGDMAKHRTDGTLSYIGRQDHQVKLRGFRIECGEIETTLISHPSIQEAIVLCRENKPGDKTLVSYVVPTENDPPSQVEISTWVKHALPDYMLPSIFIILKAFPLTPNGKIDRKALPAPDQTHRTGNATCVHPRTPFEELVANIWHDILKINQISVHDNFFELGGHSLLATQVVARLRPLSSTTLSLRTFFDRPTIAELSATIQASDSLPASSSGQLLCPQKQEGPPPLSFAQQRLLFLEQWEPGNIAYLLPYAWRLTGPLQISALEASLTALAARHESLRTSVALIDGQPVQIIAPCRPVTLDFQDLTSFSAAKCEEHVQSSIHNEQRKPFDLTSRPLWRGQLLSLGPEEHIFLLTFHHLITDGWSMGLFFRELQTLYSAQVTGDSPSFPASPLHYTDFAIWQREWLQGDELERQLTYWRTELADAPTSLDLPTDFQRPPQVSYRGKHISFSLPAQLTQALNMLSRQKGVTLFMTLLAAFQILLFRYTSQWDILIGTPIAGRTHTELEGIIGFFVNTLVVRTSFTERETFQTLVHKVRETCLGAYAHQDLPFEKLVEALQPIRDLSRHPLFQVVFQLHQADLMSELSLTQVNVLPIKGSNQAAKFDLSLELVQHDETLNGTFVFNTELFESVTITQLATHFQALLEALVKNPTTAVNDLPLMSTTEQQQLLIEWNPQISPGQPTQCIHHLFESQVTHTPEAVAIVEGNQQITYAALNHRANGLAQFLQINGVRPEARVGLCLERGIDLILVMLGILKAGGAYVPFDPATPSNRLGFMLDDAKVTMVLTSAALKEKLVDELRSGNSTSFQECSMIAVDKMWQDLNCVAAPVCQSNTTEENLAYVMYTSGSTGQPKGVGIPHRAVIRLIQEPTFLSWPAQVNCLQLASPAFDAATFEIWGCLSRGGTLFMAPPQMPSFDELSDLVRRHQITILWLTAGLFHQLVDWNIQALRPLKVLLAGGDILSPEHVRRMTAKLPHVTLINGYGPTENTTFTCCFSIPIGEDFENSVPIGCPIPQTQVYVLDPQQYLTPRGVKGELCTSGRGLGRGYFQQPALTAEKFIPHPYSPEPGGRLYRSGDIVKHRPNGTLQFIGRHDHQVKIRGYRIECGEIETVLTRHPAVQDVVVQPHEDDMGYKRLVAYVIAEKNSDPKISEFRDFLRLNLASYMIPSHYVFLDAFPLTSNGKVDHSNLPFDNQLSSQEEGAYIAPRNALEIQLTKIWETVLGIQPIGVTDNFFNLGGESLMAVRLCSEIERALSRKVPVSLIFQTQTIDQLAKTMAQRENPGPSPLMVPIQASGSNPPIFSVLFGATFKPFMNNYPNQPYYMFFNQGHDGSPALHTTVEKIAFWYLKEMQTIQPQGPYFLAGYSFGGMVAYEMAQQLRQQGETIALLALVDPTPPSSQAQLASWKLTRGSLSIDRMEIKNQEAHSHLTSPRNYFTKLFTAFQWRANSVKIQSMVMMKSILCSIFFRVGHPLPPSLRSWYRNQIVHEAARQYIPQKYQGQVSLFKSTNYVETPWRELCAEVVEVGTFPTEHLDLVDGSHTETLLHELMACLKKAQEKLKAKR